MSDESLPIVGEIYTLNDLPVKVTGLLKRRYWQVSYDHVVARPEGALVTAHGGKIGLTGWLLGLKK